jgi:hypothetical protein
MIVFMLAEKHQKWLSSHATYLLWYCHNHLRNSGVYDNEEKSGISYCLTYASELS